MTIPTHSVQPITLEAWLANMVPISLRLVAFVPAKDGHWEYDRTL